jgi:uncharacterized membrane protein YcaP (DUF421 family)
MEIVLRVFIIYVFILVALRALGKREFGQLAPMELITLLLIPEIVSNALIDNDSSLTGGLIGVSTIMVLVFFTSFLSYKSKAFQNAIEGQPTVLVHHGQLIEDNLSKDRVTPDDIVSEMHQVGLERLEQVKWAILESDGKISIVPEDRIPQSQRGSVGNRDVD